MGLNHVPDHNKEMMKQDFGTTVLITDPKSDYYLNKYRENRQKKKTDTFRKLVISTIIIFTRIPKNNTDHHLNN